MNPTDTLPDGQQRPGGLNPLLGVGLTILLVVLGGLAMGPPGDWYAALRKPSWTPPAAVFGPAWTLLYTLMAVALWRVLRRGQQVPVGGPLALYGLQLLLNIAWSPLFFRLQSPGLAFGELVLLWLAILATLRAFWGVDRVAGVLFVPYLLWVTFAGALNYVIWQLN